MSIISFQHLAMDVGCGQILPEASDQHLDRLHRAHYRFLFAPGKGNAYEVIAWV